MTLFVVIEIFMRNKCLWWRFEWDMKITEVKNKLFGLSDLNGLIRENTFDEAGRAGAGNLSFDWDHFFMDDPETRLPMTLANFKAMAQDPEQVKILAKYNFNGTIPSPAAFSNAKTRAKKRVGSTTSDLNNSMNFLVEFFERNSAGINPEVLYVYQEQKERSEQAKLEVKANYDKTISSLANNSQDTQYETLVKNVKKKFQDDMFAAKSIFSQKTIDDAANYFSTIANLAITSVQEAIKGGINLSGIKTSLIEDGIDGNGAVVSFVYIPKSLYFFFINVYINSGRGFYLKPYKDRIPDCFKNFIDSYYRTIKANSVNIDFSENNVAQNADTEGFTQQLQSSSMDLGRDYRDIVQTVFLDNLGIKYGTYLSRCADVLFKTYFAGDNINRIIATIDRLKAERMNIMIRMADGLGVRGEYRDTAGVLMHTALAALSSYELNIKNLIDQIANVIPGDEFAPFRNALYRKKYEMLTGNRFDDKFLTDVSECFGVPTDSLFDPLFGLPYRSINAGFSVWIKGRPLEELLKNPIYVTANVADPNIGYISPIEKIFLTAHALNRRLSSTFKKYGTGPERHQVTTEVLLSEASEGIRTFNTWNPTSVIPQPQRKLKSLFVDTQKNMEGENDELGFWQILELDNQIKDKTQTDIYYFLIDHSAKGVNWKYEYNRNDKVDDDLGQKSIDILAELPGRRFCFEYQGEQHYRLLQVKIEDDKQFPLFLLMKYYILHKCGFALEKIGSDYYVTGLIPEVWERNKNNVRNIIIETYIYFLEGITKNEAMVKPNYDIDLMVQRVLAMGRFETTRGLNEDLGPHSVNRNFKYFSGRQGQFIDYFNDIISRGTQDESNFDEPALNEQVPYVGSPVRFMDEIQTAVNMARDWEKRDVLRNKKDGVWEIAYIVPKKNLTTDDLSYTEKLAGNANAIFKWEGPKKKNAALINYMVANGIGEAKGDEETQNTDKKTTIKENKKNYTLFESAVMEAFREHPDMQENMSVIYRFIEQYEDFTDSDIENGYEKVYRPAWHVKPFQFWFNPPYNENGTSLPTLSGAIALLSNGKIMVESMKDGLFYNLDECLDNSIREFALAIQQA